MMKTVITNEKDERFLRLVEELDREYYINVGEKLDRFHQYNDFKTPHVVILLLNTDEAIACASYRVYSKNTVEFKRVYVKKEYRQQKIAYTLIKELEKKVIRNGFRYSYIITGKMNTAAVNLYKKLNYTPVDNFGQFKDDDIVICMKKTFK